MSFDGDEKRWICGKVGAVNMQRMSSIVQEIRDPCLHHSPTKGSKLLKPGKWQSNFDSDGKIFGFGKALKLIVLGGVDSSIRAEVWEFLLGCYALGSTAEYREQLRMARRERYGDLIRECQTMHSSIGTGTLAYVVGSKVMDVRTLSKDNDIRASEGNSGSSLHDTTITPNSYSALNNDCADTSSAFQRASCSGSDDLVNARENACSGAYDSPHMRCSSDTYNCFSTQPGQELDDTQYAIESYFDFPPLPVTNLFQNSDQEENECEAQDCRPSSESTFRLEDKSGHSFEINGSVDLNRKLNALPSVEVLHSSNSETDMFCSDVQEQLTESKKMEYKMKIVNRLRISDVPEPAMMHATTTIGMTANEDRVSEWLWTLHRIVVDVVRTDNHLDFYGDTKNMARMSDILAVYAWIDPSTGYCQGMSDLLSPFVILYEDNADAFWCFEMLLRRMRDNFQMEGPIGVMKQLRALWKILELTDTEIFAHLSLIGAESLHFAFRMLLVLFRRELSFNEALCMWEMMWAADFDEDIAQKLEENCLEKLVLQLPKYSCAEMRTESTENGLKYHNCGPSEYNNDGNSTSNNIGARSISSNPFCGLTRASFWVRHDQLQICSTSASTRNGDDELPVFCVAAILIFNRQKIMRGTHSIDDVIKMFNDKMLKINVKRCVRMAIKLRKKYFFKLIKQTSTGSSEQ